MALATTLVSAGPASAAPAGCDPGFVCLYQDVDFRDPSLGGPLLVRPSQFACPTAYAVPPRNARDWVSSVFNNSAAHVELWDWNGPGADFLVGTAVRGKGYSSLGAGNDRTNTLIALGCV
jgi:hypothetical protein